jgi:hypothetical protein
MAKKRGSDHPVQPDGSLPAADLLSPFRREVTIPYLPEARKFTQRQQIHPRRNIPPVPEGLDVPDPHPSPPTALGLPQAMMDSAAAAPVLTDDLTLVRNTELGSVADNDTASEVGEPSVASNGDVVFYTGNWYAAVSTDGGATFLYVDPYNAFPDPPGMGFCCDQVVHYIRRIDTFVWLLQYTEDNTGANIQRLAFAKTADVRQGRWRTFDVTPQSLGLSNVFLDFPDLAVGRNMLYTTTNGFLGQNWTATILLRFPLSGISSGNITAQHAISTENFNFRVAQYSETRAFWASHNTTSSLRVFSWDEEAPQPTFNDVTVARWAAGQYQSNTPDGFNWLGRADPRILGATKAGNNLYFAWGANRGGANNRPNPYVQIARIDASDFSVLDNVNIWDATSAINYAALATNSRREVGISYMIGGGGRFPTHVVGILTGNRKDVVTVEGMRGPSRNRWGDYLTIRRHYPNTKLFVATGYTLQSGSGSNDATPHFVIFGRSRDLA